MTQIVGQPHALETLDHALRSGRFHHAWIFSGPRGVGKFTTAIEVAKALLDPDSPRNLHSLIAQQSSPIQSPKSKIQNLIESSTHPDLHIIRKERALYSSSRTLRDRKQMNIPVELLRELVIGGKSGETCYDAPAYRTAQLGHGKVFIIDEAELLDTTGQNTMLKTLEEPPVDTYFFLITSQPDRLLPTIRSRCQHVRFGRLDQSSMKAWLKTNRTAMASRAASTDMPLLISNALEWIEQFADGSPGVALLSMEYGFYQWQTTLDPMLADLNRGKFPTAMGDALAGMVEGFAEAWVSNHGKKTTSKDAANKDGVRHVLSLLSSHARQKLAEHAAQGGDASEWIAVIDLLRDAERDLESNVNMKLLLENLVVQWAQAVSPNKAAA